MSQDDELNKLRQKRLAEMQQDAAQRQAMGEEAAYQQQQQQFEAQKQAILQKILSNDARSRLSNIRMARPEYAEQIELQLIQAAQAGVLRGKIPLSDEMFKSLLIQLQQQSSKHEGKVKFQ